MTKNNNLKWCAFQEAPTVTDVKKCEKMEDAIGEARYLWNHLTANEQKVQRVYACTCNFETDEEGDEIWNDVDEIVWDSDIEKGIENMSGEEFVESCTLDKTWNINGSNTIEVTAEEILTSPLYSRQEIYDDGTYQCYVDKFGNYVRVDSIDIDVKYIANIEV